MLEAVKMGGVEDAARFVDKGMPQSELFMAEMIPIIHRLYSHLPEGARKAALDVGPQNFAGTELLARIHSPRTFCRLKMSVTAVDIHDRFRLLGELVAPDVEFLVQNIFSIKERVWDFTVASHVIEHVPKPAAFVRRLQELSRDFVLLATPWREDPLTTTGHINTIDKKFVRAVGGRDLDVYTNYNWGKEREVCSFWVPGLAGD
jgi:hypothetical protein